MRDDRPAPVSISVGSEPVAWTTKGNLETLASTPKEARYMWGLPSGSTISVPLYASPQAPAELVRVKELEFRRLHEDWCADTIVGRYYVEEVQWKWQARLFTTNCDAVTEQVITRGQGFEDAKQAAQADYEKRVLPALAFPATVSRENK